MGSTLPRIWTPPLVQGAPGPCGCGCALTPATSYGFDVVEFASQGLDHPLDPWQRLAAIHGGELLPDGRPRFRIIIILVARQNGKTELLVVLSLFWQFIESRPLVLGTSTKLDYARESWTKGIALAEASKTLDKLRPAQWTRQTNGEQESWTTEGCRYKIAASNAKGGRSLTVDRLILDELREHRSYAAYAASEPAASPWDAQIWALSNAGDDGSVVLNDLREEAVRYVETGEGDPRLGIMEWSAERDADPEDPYALAQANPNLGRRGTDAQTLVAAGARAKRAGGQALTAFKTEQMCIRVKAFDPAIDPDAWRSCREDGDLSAVRQRIALCIDLAPDGQHATLTAAGVLPDGRVRVEPVRAWSGSTCVLRLRRELLREVKRVNPMVLGWFPSGPGATMAADLRKRAGWPPPGVVLTEIKADSPAVCMGFESLVRTCELVHSGDPLQDAQVASAERARRGDGSTWVYARAQGGHCDAVYAAAGAAHLARTLPPPVGKPRLIVAR